MLCPTCHSDVGTGSLDESDRVQGAQGTDSEGRPVPQWSDDPILTPRGLNGETYVGDTLVRKAIVHLQELQDQRHDQEDEAGIPQTEFSDFGSDNHVLVRHIIELRQSTERLLNASGSTLEEYFKLDADGNEVAQNPILSEDFGISNPQDEWIEVERGAPYIDKNGAIVTSFELPDATSAQSPTLPENTKIKGIHIEDLRHPVSVSQQVAMVSGGSSISVDPNLTRFYEGIPFEGIQISHANFKKIVLA